MLTFPVFVFRDDYWRVISRFSGCFFLIRVLDLQACFLCLLHYILVLVLMKQFVLLAITI